MAACGFGERCSRHFNKSLLVVWRGSRPRAHSGAKHCAHLRSRIAANHPISDSPAVCNRAIRVDTKARIGVRNAAAGSTCKRFLSFFCQSCDLDIPGRTKMKYSLALALLLCGIVSSNGATLRDRIRLAQTRDFAECIQNCNSVNFSCASNCGLSGSCVAQCTVEATSCKARCNESK
jgi:hypothetical protein